jgi:hypothetical protein
MYSKVVCIQLLVHAEYRTLEFTIFETTKDVFGRAVGFLDYGASLRNAYADAGTSNASQGLKGPISTTILLSFLAWSSLHLHFFLIGAIGGNFWAFDLDPKWGYKKSDSREKI